jgi:primosomal protein N' (replication factor Y)
LSYLADMPMLFTQRDPADAPRFADVILPLSLPDTLTYGIPEKMQGLLKPGMRVEVSLGRNRQFAAIVQCLHDDEPEAYQVKPVKNIIDEHPVVDDIQLRFWNWIAQYYVAAPGEVMQAALPAHLKLSGETKLIWIHNEERGVIEWSDAGYLAAEALEMRGSLLMSELRAITGQKHFNEALNELLEHEVVEVDDALEPGWKPKKQKVVRLDPHYLIEANMHELFDSLQKAPRQLEVIMAYIELSVKKPFVTQQDLLERSGATAAQVKSLSDKQVFVIEEKDVDKLAMEKAEPMKELSFTDAQDQAYQALQQGLSEKEVALLEGVTGSGKTLLYIHRIRQCLAEGKQAVFLLPEIALTTQLVSRLRAYFGEQLGVYHSRFTNNEKITIWEAVKKRRINVILGPRSAIWLPYDKLGVIIVDEEHDGSYKQKDPAPRFHARDAAIYLAALHGAKVILGSATPSVESLYNVRHGKYAFAALKERYQGVKMPEIKLVNARSLDAMRGQGIKMITPELYQAMLHTLEQKKQVILFQNRRGYAPFQICTFCGWVPQCKNCSVSLTYHKSTDKLHCHYCGVRTPVVHTCAVCGSNRLQSKSFGTERIEEEVQQMFPKARIARMDIDSMRGKNKLPELMDQLEKQKIDILVGTQMVVKGLDFAHVALVGILSADSLLSFPDFRVNERAFQLMEQVSGRAGRTDGEGRVLIQAYNLTHPVLKWVSDHDVRSFYVNEIGSREFFGYPPFSRLIRIIFKDKSEPKAIAAAAEIAKSVTEIEGTTVQGPVPAVISKVRNLFIQEVWIKCRRDSNTLEQVKGLLKDQRKKVLGKKGNGSMQVVFDIDPV